jgi:hypothetical protein
MVKDALGVLAGVGIWIALWFLLPVILLVPVEIMQHSPRGAVLKGRPHWEELAWSGHQRSGGWAPSGRSGRA